MEKVVKIKCDNCGAVILISKDAKGNIVQDTIVAKPDKPAPDEVESKKESDWFDEI